MNVPPKGTMPDRVVDPKGRIRCRILEFVPTDAETVYTAVLACGHRVRYDVVRFGRQKRSTICPQCTAARPANKKVAT